MFDVSGQYSVFDGGNSNEIRQTVRPSEHGLAIAAIVIRNDISAHALWQG